jgi:hypothetical protein
MLQIRTKYSFLFCLLLTGLLVLGEGEIALGQSCVQQVRTYASRQQKFTALGGLVENDARAVDNDPTTFSRIGFAVGLLGESRQFLQFETSPGVKRTIPANTPLTIKLSLPASLLGLASGITIQPFTNLNNLALGAWGATAAGPSYTTATLLGLINGAGEVEITMTPNVPFEGVSVQLNAVLGVAMVANVYGAYIMENTASPVNCNARIDVLTGVRAGGLALLDATGSVTSPLNAIDNDLNTFSLLNTGASVLSQVFETVIFNSPSQAGDSAKIVLQDPGGQVLNLNLLTSFTIQPYLKNVAAGAAFTTSSGLLSLRLLPGGGNKYEVVFPVNTPFDRIEISQGGLVGAFNQLRIYDINRVIPKPAININTIEATSLGICKGSTAALSVGTTQSCTTYKWYNVAIGGTALYTGTSYTPLAASLVDGLNTFYVEAQRDNCTSTTSARTEVKITVNPIPTATITGTKIVCQFTTAPLITLTGATGTAPYTFTYAINGVQQPLLTTVTANSITVPVPTATQGNYSYTLIKVKDSSSSQCEQTQNGTATITVTKKPTQPLFTIN